MSEKIYSLLLRLFPPRFRARWLQESLELYRDRAAHEAGFLPRLRLWSDLLIDSAISLPRLYLRDDSPVTPAVQNSTHPVPSFTLLESQPIRSSAFFYGTVLSIVALTGISLLAKHAGHFPILHPGSTAEASGITVDPWSTGAARAGEGGGGTEVIGNGGTSSAAAASSGQKPPHSVIRVASSPAPPLFDADERQRVIQGLVATLNQHYADPAAARSLGALLQRNQRSGGYDAVNDPRAFAALLTRQLRAAAQDAHFEVIFSPQAMREQSPSTVSDAAYRAALRQANCTFEQVGFLPHNIGYLKLDAFPSPEVCGDTAIAAMKTLGRADALIIDLRDNSGGSPDMVMFLASWLFDRPAFFYNPRESGTDRMWTRSPTAGSHLADKPVWVLTSSRTWSAAEHFAYNLKMLHRATIVGETTAGATDTGIFHRIDDHFGVGLRESRVPNPYPVPDWTARGVDPDVRAPADAALATAQSLAAARLAGR